MNKVLLIGRLGADPNTRYTQDGKAITTFSIATDEFWKGRDGETQKRTEWHRMVAFGRLAEICRDYLQKGALVSIEGKAQTRNWEDKDKNKRYMHENVLQHIEFLSRGKSQVQEPDAPPEEETTPPEEPSVPPSA